jgi:hypothetical protein
VDHHVEPEAVSSERLEGMVRDEREGLPAQAPAPRDDDNPAQLDTAALAQDSGKENKANRVIVGNNEHVHLIRVVKRPLVLGSRPAEDEVRGFRIGLSREHEVELGGHGAANVQGHPGQ